MIDLEKRIFTCTNENFEEIALEVFYFQYANCLVYRQYVDLLKQNNPKNTQEIPFLPIEFFKNKEIYVGNVTPNLIFKSSGTTLSVRSKHFVLRQEMYEKSFIETYENFTGDIKNQVILALLPNYLEQGDSSLVYMVSNLIEATGSNLSGFFKNDLELLLQNYDLAIKSNKKVVLFGVSYALLDLAELKPNLSQALIIETGGMKGKRKELSKEKLHEILQTAFQTEYISSEYGMTELLSQAYSNQDGYFFAPPWMQFLIRDTNDPFTYLTQNKTGGINVIDLANLYSCSFIATQDLGQLSEKGLKLMGRFDLADIRGCNLLVE